VDFDPSESYQSFASGTTTPDEASIDMKTNNQGPWSVLESEYPAQGTQAQKWEFLLRYATLAPSSHNTQPWKFRHRHASLEIHADRERACPVVDPHDRELIMSCGCALFHLKCAMRHFGCLGQIEILPEHNPNLLARLHWGAEVETDATQTKLFNAIAERRTNRQPFKDVPLPPEFLATLKGTAASENARLHSIDDEPTRLALADLIWKADRTQWADAEFRRELSRWIHPNRSLRQDGIPGYASGVDDLLSSVGPLVVRTFDLGEGEAARDQELAIGSPGLVVLCTSEDSPRDWVAAGQALAAVLLQARSQNIWASFLNQPIEIPGIRHQLRTLIDTAQSPQCILRLGYADAVKPTPRRDVEEVLI